MFTKRELLRDLAENVFCRLAPSPIHGIGVFAIRDIPPETDPFVGLCMPSDKWVWLKVPEKEVMFNPQIPDSVKKLVYDLYIVREGYVFFPQHGLNEVSVGYFPNHSDNPNLREEDEGTFITIRHIHCGEELTVDYRTFTEYCM